MKVVLVNKSDTTGGAAVVTFRLMLALRKAGVDARMLVEEKLTDSPYVTLIAPHWRLKWNFFLERLRIFISNGFNRSTLFKIDTGQTGVDISRHPLVRNADAVLINWINQGILSLKSIRELIDLQIPIIWTMHDMWCMTGICHHAGNCIHFMDNSYCNVCPLLGKKAWRNSLANNIFRRKQRLYSAINSIEKGKRSRIVFVAVSSWLAKKGKESDLLKNMKTVVIPNPFDIRIESVSNNRDVSCRVGECQYKDVKLLFGAARLDDPIKGWPILIESLLALKRKAPELASRCELIIFGTIKNATLLENIPISSKYLGRVSPTDLPSIYKEADMVLSTSLFETLPGTLVEGQAYGAVPIAFNRGGQDDIIDHLSTGYLVEWSDDLHEAGSRIADGIISIAGILSKNSVAIKREMKESVRNRFSDSSVAQKYIELIRSL